METMNPLRSGMRLKKRPPAQTLVILGATGDLTHSKLIPSLYSLYQKGFLPSTLSIIAFARRDKTDEDYRQDIKKALTNNQAHTGNDQSAVERFARMIHYHRGDLTAVEPYKALQNKLKSVPNRLYYLATPPNLYEKIIGNFGAAGLAKPEKGWTRLVIEKPFGFDLASAQALNQVLLQVFDEDQVFRIDHYLGKETVQNILVFRFANGIFEPIWNRRYIDHVQITVAETAGVKGRESFFEQTGILRDIVQNHMMQLLCLTAMEPPSSFEPNAVRDEKIKVLRAVNLYQPKDVDDNVVRAQYRAGTIWNQTFPGYLEEDDVPADSTTETFIGMKILLNNWRWAGVPFYLRTGKRLPKKVTEIAIYFKEAPLQIFGPEVQEGATTNLLTLNIQPDEGISLKFDSKVPGYASLIRPVTMEFRYGSSFGMAPPDAYERLLLDAMTGDATLFTRADETEKAWEILQPIIDNMQDRIEKLPQYPVGHWGPPEADALITKDGKRWRRL